eukprot:TRINITY_DN466_c0_g1_i8.p1 TRINITY_DN466_c0_g1~~TRINITY_DN466_c0_g1_i8.p1  ORF type:complete len:119 (-),score=46.28 TRINITY_DN466_c0_g1_i8:22-378(-)
MALEQAKDLENQQNEQLDEIINIASNLKDNAGNINMLIDQQKGIIEDVDKDVDVAREKMNFVMKKLSVLLKTSDTGLLCTVMILIGILFVLIVLFLSLIHICRCRRLLTCRSRWSPYH